MIEGVAEGSSAIPDEGRRIRTRAVHGSRPRLRLRGMTMSGCMSVSRRELTSMRPRRMVACILAVLVSGCYVQQPLPHAPTYRPASWEPVLGVVMKGGEEVTFDEPALVESGRVVGRVDGARYVAGTPDIERLLVGRKTLDKKRTWIFGAILITVFTVFFASIGLD